eukprot:scaffold1931_cov162-Amphora_coffeaeformis.AAC.8
MEQERELIARQEVRQDLVRFIGIARWDDEDDSFFLIGDHTETGHDYGSIAAEILDQLKHQEEKCVAAQFETTFGYWFVKRLVDGYTYLVSTSKDYPPSVAVECIDDLSTTFEATRKKKSNRQTPSECCQGILEKYGTMEEGTIAWALVHEIEEPVRTAYEDELIAMMQQQVESVQNKLHKNIVVQLENMEDTEALQKKSDDLMVQAAVFKKNAAKLPKKGFFNKKRVWVTAAGAFVGGCAGIAMGGVGTPAVVPATIVFAEGIEMVVAGTLVGVGSHVAYVWAKQRWFAFQKRVYLDMSRIVD